MSDTPPPARPKIEVVRLPSAERAKLRPLLEGGIQLEAQFQHMRYGDYASYSSLDDASKQEYNFYDYDYMGHKTPLATKSLDNIFAKQLAGGRDGRGSPFLWRDATRSEEHLYHAAPNYHPTGVTTQPSTPSRFSAARSRIAALLKKLSPRPRHKAAPPTSPWVVVEFSNQDLDSPDASGRTNSVTSDLSFDMAVRANRLRRGQIARGSEEQLNSRVVQITGSTHILIESPRRLSNVSQSSGTGSDKYSKSGDTKTRRTSGSGLAATRHRPAFNTGMLHFFALSSEDYRWLLCIVSRRMCLI